MKKIFSILVLYCVLIMPSSAESNQRHLGDWVTTTPDGFALIWRFTETSLIYDGTGKNNITNSYTIDYNQSPIWLDIQMNYSVSINSTDVNKTDNVKCIVEFLSVDSFRVVGEVIRPEGFNGAKNILIFRRKTKIVQQAGPAYPPQGVGSADP